MIEFFRDILSGPLYYVIVVFAIIFIMAIIGFIMERKQKEKEEKDKVVFVAREPVQTENKEIPQASNEDVL